MRGKKNTRGALAALAAIISVSVLAATGTSAGAATKKFNAVGQVHCTATGKVSFGPKLTATPKAKTKLKVSAKLTCTTGTTGNGAVTVISGSFSAKTTGTTASCATTDFGPGTAKASWKATGGKVATSKLILTNSTVTDGTNVVVDLRGHGPGQTGSYANEQWTMHIVGDATPGGICGETAKGKGFKFTGTGGTSTFDIKAANPNNLPIEHVVVLMQENRSADHYLGHLSTQGQPAYEAEPNTGNPDPTNPSGPPILPFHQTNYCEVKDLDHSWNGTHAEWNNGAMDGFTARNVDATLDPNGHRTMGYYDSSDLPFYYGLYSTFATGDRYFSSILTQTFPNRLYLLAGTSFGLIRNDFSIVGSPYRSVFNILDEGGVTWKIYQDDPNGISYGSLFFKYVNDQRATHVFPVSQYYTDLANGTLPDVSYIDPTIVDPPHANDEHPPANVQVGQKFVADAINGLIGSSSWPTSAFFLSYDEHGGFYDHVPPPAAVAPDNTPPNLQPGDTPGGFDRYGIRVPAVVVSPYSKPGFVSHVTQDHTSILRFIETRFGLPNLTQRDLNADPMLDHFDFSTPALLNPPVLPTAVVDPTQANCNG